MSEAVEQAQPWRPMDTFGTRLLLIRKELGLSQEQAAARCGLDDGSWSNWENGTSPRNLPVVVHHIVSALNVDRDWLIWGGGLSPSSTKWYLSEGNSAGQRHLHSLGEVRLPGIW